MKKQIRAFTLIELLIVVLIIGILAAVALPQYQKAVEKSRLSEAYNNLNALKNSMEMYILENGTAAYDLFADETRPELIGFSCATVVDGTDTYCATKDFLYEAYCSNRNCYVNAFRYKKSDYSDIRGHYALSYSRSDGSVQSWPVRTCCWHTNQAKELCNSLPNITRVIEF